MGKKSSAAVRKQAGGSAEPSSLTAPGASQLSSKDEQDLFVNPPSPSEYLVHAGLRWVKPYTFDFAAHAKPSWSGFTAEEALARFFPRKPRSYYSAASRLGRIWVECRSSSRPRSAPLLAGERVRHVVHRHEPPTLDQPVEVISTTSGMCAVLKPASVPVHPAGRFRKNSVTALLAATRPELGKLYPVHRLDKPVGGLLLMARSPEDAKAVSKQMADRSVCKEYVARVNGSSFPSSTEVDVPLAWNHEAARALVSYETDAKEAQTYFRVLARLHGSDECVVKCKPYTGRPHQIRAHLSHLGHPIANDVLYGGDEPASPDFPREELEWEDDKHQIDPVCTLCPNLHPSDVDFYPFELWLFAARYTGPDWQFACALPEWATVTDLDAEAQGEVRRG
jgi:RluA family pseudouridine synthase